VLDWRERAHEFGLMPLGDRDEAEHVVQPPRRLIDEDDIEAYEGRRPSAEDDEANDVFNPSSSSSLPALHISRWCA
jgi:hypothetical protein